MRMGFFFILHSIIYKIQRNIPMYIYVLAAYITRAPYISNNTHSIFTRKLH